MWYLRLRTFIMSLLEDDSGAWHCTAMASAPLPSAGIVYLKARKQRGFTTCCMRLHYNRIQPLPGFH